MLLKLFFVFIFFFFFFFADLNVFEVHYSKTARVKLNEIFKY